jgi:methionine-rich copper-binding protein CopC
MAKLYRKRAFFIRTLSVTALLTSALFAHAKVETTTPKQALLPYQAEYRISSNSLTTTATRTLSKTGNQWRLSQEAKLMFIKVSEESIIEDGKDGLRPLRYDYRNNLSSRQDQRIIFNWQKNIASDKKYRKPWSAPLLEDSFDQLSAQLKIREVLLRGRLKKPISQTIYNRGKQKTYVIEKLDEELIITPVGKLRTVKLRRYREGSDSETVVWMAKDWNYIIVRLEQQDDDDIYSLELLSASIDGKTLSGLK